jgi:hypothetical protein
VYVSEEKLLEKWKGEGKCCFPSCPKRAGGKAERIKRCSGCLEVRYHDRMCQKAYVVSFISFVFYLMLISCRRDWSRHRDGCKLKAREREAVETDY